jgi:hypothetical protein
MSDSTEVKKQIIKDEIDRWNNSIYLWGVRLRVAKKIGERAME